MNPLDHSIYSYYNPPYLNHYPPYLNQTILEQVFLETQLQILSPLSLLLPEDGISPPIVSSLMETRPVVDLSAVSSTRKKKSSLTDTPSLSSPASSSSSLLSLASAASIASSAGLERLTGLAHAARTPSSASTSFESASLALCTKFETLSEISNQLKSKKRELIDVLNTKCDHLTEKEKTNLIDLFFEKMSPFYKEPIQVERFQLIYNELTNNDIKARFFLKLFKLYQKHCGWRSHKTLKFIRDARPLIDTHFNRIELKDSDKKLLLPLYIEKGCLEEASILIKFLSGKSMYEALSQTKETINQKVRDSAFFISGEANTKRVFQAVVQDSYLQESLKTDLCTF